MITRLAAFIVTAVLFFPAYVMSGLYDNDDDMIQVDAVEEQNTGGMLDSTIVKPYPQLFPRQNRLQNRRQNPRRPSQRKNGPQGYGNTNSDNGSNRCRVSGFSGIITFC